jgi:hypothetical protein
MSLDIVPIGGMFLLGPPKSAGGRILETRGFGDFERFLFDRKTLAFVAMPRPTPLQDDGARAWRRADMAT